MLTIFRKGQLGVTFLRRIITIESQPIIINRYASQDKIATAIKRKKEKSTNKQVRAIVHTINRIEI